MDVKPTHMAAIGAVALLAINVALLAESASDVVCVVALGIGSAVFFGGFFGLLSIMSIGLILAYPFMKSARKEVSNLGGLTTAIFGLVPVACGLAVYFAGGC